MIAITRDDLVVGRGDGIAGPDIPAELEALPDRHLRVVEGVVVDATENTAWWIDQDGVKHIGEVAGRQAVACGIDAPLQMVDGTWVVRTVTHELAAYARDKRWQVEVGGLNVAGVPVATDDRAKLMVIGARVAAEANPDWSTIWQGMDGNAYPIDAAAMLVISDAVHQHVNVTFSALATVLAAIAAETITTKDQVDQAFAQAA